ncbi:Uu.00g072110.m01.CDS01 [Anthostomella pinea]|uniref:Uu.00g072110.m01.CDS01 n=1 Tax=Anthostomella pinea TaxID=933095 RepID=A0AAI8YNY2_9PEZI|nr:Uu.00g072110.m01.CDS01 [Anthostomella pinea]
MPPRPSPTHFLCIQLVNAASRHQLSANLASFTADVTSPDSFGIPEQAIRPVGTLHLTVGMMSFPKNEGLDKAVALLKTLNPRQIVRSVLPPSTTDAKPTPDHQVTETKELSGPPSPLLSVTLKGLHSMQSPSKASILYAPPVDEEDTLMRFCEKLRSAFLEAELMTEENRLLLLHATVVNTIYVKGRSSRGGGKGRSREKLTIDARGILERYDEFVWMQDVPIEKIAICKMGAKKRDDGDEAYEVEAEIDMTG